MIVYAFHLAERVHQQGWPGLAAAAAVTAITGVWICLLELEGTLKAVGLRTLRRMAALTLIALSIVLNSILLLRALLRGESLGLLRLISTLGLLYGLRLFVHWPNA